MDSFGLGDEMRQFLDENRRALQVARKEDADPAVEASVTMRVGGVLLVPLRAVDAGSDRDSVDRRMSEQLPERHLVDETSAGTLAVADRYQYMPTMVETRPVTCPSCGRQTVTLCSCNAGSTAGGDLAHCPKCAKVPEIKPHVWVAPATKVAKS